MAALPETLTAGRVALPGESHLRAFARSAFPFLVLGSAWEIVAHLGIFPTKLFPRPFLPSTVELHVRRAAEFRPRNPQTQARGAPCASNGLSATRSAAPSNKWNGKNERLRLPMIPAR